MQQKDSYKHLSGVIPVLPIPFDASEEIDEAALCLLIDFAATSGVGGICLPAYGSEFYKLSDEERTRVVKLAVQQSRGRVPIVAQCNHGSSRIALSFAEANLAAGADVLAIAIPRQFAVPEDDLLRYLASIMSRINVPWLVQDFNPGGSSASARFVVRLLAECPNFRYLKLEEPLLAPKVVDIRQATKDRIGVLEGWGGLYLMELIPAGICGVIPGLALADILSLVFRMREQNQSDGAFLLFEKVLPQIAYAMQNLELYLYCEKRLLQARGLLPSARCRTPSFTPDSHSARYIDELNNRVLRALEYAGLPAVLGQG